MMEGPSGAAGMSSFQTTLSCCILRDVVVSVKEKARNGHVEPMEVNESESPSLSVERTKSRSKLWIFVGL